MNLYKKIVGIVLVFSIFFTSAAPLSRAAEVKGKCGEDCTYTLSEDGVLTISGTGTITKKFNEDEQINKKIRKIIIEEGIQKIGNDCFKNLVTEIDSDIDISMPGTLTEVGNNALSPSHIEEIELPKNIKKVGDANFEYNKMEKVIFPDTVEKIGEWTFNDSSVREVVLPPNLTQISKGMFAGCKKLEKIQWPLNLLQIDQYAFSDCNFKNFKIPDTVKSVGAYTFDNCSQLKVITIGKSVQQISKKFVSNCFALKKIVNNSQISIPLNTLKGKRNWYVGGKKVTKLKPGKTAKSAYQKYKIKYELDGGKVVGKKPKTYTYRQKAKLPAKAEKKGYAFLGWFISAKNDWECFPEYITEKLYGTLTAKAIFKKYEVTSSDGRIKVTVKDGTYGKKGYDRDCDAYFFRYSENKDMSNSTVVVFTAPYGKGLSRKLKKGKTYYVQITRYFELYMEDSEDYEEPFCGWHCKRKVTIE